MKQEVNEKYEPLFKKAPNIRYVILMGGRGAGRSTVASQYAKAKLRAKEYFRCAIMRFVLSDVRNSIYQEILDRVEEDEVTDITVRELSFEHGKNLIKGMGFRKSSSDQKSKLKSLANYNTVIIEEADEIPEADFMQLDDSLRTVKGDITIILLLNPPPKNHWIVRRFFDLEEAEIEGFFIPILKPELKDTLFIRTNYRDNIKNLAEQSVANYKRYQETKPDHYWNMVEGFIPEVVKGRIYKEWNVVDEIPHEARLECYGLDFGFDPDPAAIVAVHYYNGGYILDEITYQTQLKNRQLATILLNQEKAVVVADHAEPKSIAEIEEAGVTIVPCTKGADSVRFGIKKVQGLKISYTKRSKNLQREYEAYRWKADKEGELTEVVDPTCEDHLMDALRYAFLITTPEQHDVKTKQEEHMARTTHRQVLNSTK